MGQFQFRRGSINDLPSTLADGEVFIVNLDVNGGELDHVARFVGPPGGGTPVMASNSVSCLAQPPNNLFFPTSGGAGLPPNAFAGFGTVSLNTVSIGDYEGATSFDDTWIRTQLQGVAAVPDTTDGVFYRVLITLATDGSVSVTVKDKTGTNTDPSNASGHVTLAT